MANQNFRVKKGLEVGLGATFLYADTTGVGIGSTQPRSKLDVRGQTQTVDLLVSGVSTLGLTTTIGDLYVGGDLFVADDIVYDEITGRNLSISGIASIGFLSATDARVSGGSTFLGPVNVDSDLVVTGVSTFTGVATFQSDLNVGGNLNVLGDIVYDEITGRNLSISGIATIANLEVSDSLNVTGPSTFVGLVSFINAVGTGLTLRSIDAHTGKFVEITFESGGGPGGPSSNTGITSNFITTQDLFITGVATFTTGVTTQLFAENILAGVVTTTDLFFNAGFGTNLTVTNLDVTGIATLNGSGIATIGGDPVFNTLTVTGVSSLAGDVNVGSALSVAGETFFAGVGTFGGDLNVEGNLILDGDINLDEVLGRNLLISGVGTINTLRSNVGVITTANIEDLNVSGISTVGVITVYEYLADSKAQVGAGDSILATVGGKLLWTRPDLVGISTEFEPGSTFYVSENGSNTNDGRSLEKSWRSINYALSQIPDGVEDTLVIGSGVYEETFPLNVPKGLTIRGSGQRATFIVPTSATETNDGFILDNASTVEDITIGNMLKPNGSENYAFKFAVGAAITTRSPYISRVTVLNRGTNVTADDPYGYNSADAYPASAPSGGGVLADGSVVDASSLEAAMLLNEVTMFVPANKGLVITNGARSEFLNGFIYFAEQGIVGVSSRGTGFAGNGKTRLSLDNASGGLVGGNTIQYYDTDATSILASGTIDSVSGSYVFLTNAGVGTFAVPRNRTAKSVEFVGSAEISNTQARFGPTSLDLVGASDCIAVADSSDFGFGTGDFTIEFWYYRVGNTNNSHIVDFRNTNTDNAISILGNGGNVIEVEVADSVVITGSTAPTLNAWTHIAVARQSGTLRLFIDGVVDGTAAVATDLGASKPLVVGADFNQSNGIDGFADDFRIEKGVAKYTGAFATPTAALKGDKDTSILLHFDGSDGDTTTTDDIIVYQDIRITGGNTADKANLADYSQFGADLRSIGCAVEYGSQGIIGDGDGVTLRLIAVNFNHIGALGDISNDPNLVNQPNEVIEIGNGQVSYVSIDQGGDFRVGDAFYVNQETGEVSFTDTVTDLTALSSLTITDGTNSSIITPTSGRFGNVLISGQTVESVTGDLELKAAGAGEINIYGNTNIIGILTAQVIEINAIQKGDTSIALDDTGSDGTIRFNTDGVEAARIDSNQRTGIKTDNPRAQLDVVGTTRLENLTVTGVATLNGTGIATIGGDPTFRNLNVTGLSTFAGVGTFLSDLNVGGNLNVLGDIVYDEITGRNLSISGIASVGFLSATDVRVSGAATFLGDVRIDGAQIVDDLGASNLNVTGIATIGFLTATDAHVGNGLTVRNLTVTGDAQLNGSGIVTAGQDINFRNLEVAGFSTFVGLQSFISAVGTSLTVFNLRVPDNGVVSLPGIPVSGGDAEFRNLNVTGVSSYAGVATFGSDLYVDGDLFVSGLDFRETLAGENLFVSGVGTVNTLRSMVGFITDLSVSGTSTFVGVATFQNDVFIDGNLNLTGDIFYDEITGRNLSISGIATIGFLSATDAVVGNGLTVTDLTVTGEANLNGSGIVTSGQDVSFRNLEITGFSTFVGFATFNNASISTAFIQDDLLVFGTITANFGNRATFSHVNATSILSTAPVGIATLRVVDTDFVDAEGASVGFATITDTSIGFATITEAYVGVLTVGLLDGGGGTVIGDDIETRNLRVAGLSTFVGVGTFENDLYVGGDLNVLGDLTFDEATLRNLTVTGVSTLGVTSITTAFIGLGTVLELQSNLILANQGNFNNIYVPGIATIGNLISDGGNQIIIEGSTVITGIVTIGGNSVTIDGNESFENIRIGPPGVPAVVSGAQTGGKRTFARFEDGRFDIMNVTGITTTNDLLVSAATTTTDLRVVGFATITEGYVGVLTVGTLDGGGTAIGNDIETRNLRVTGLSTFVGVATFQSDLNVGGNLNVLGDIVYDEITGRNLSISGIATINDARITEANIGFATITQGYVGVLTVGSIDGGGTVVGNDIETRNLRISGLSTFVGVGTFENDLYVGGDLNVLGDIVYDEITGRNLNITGISSLGTVEISSGIITANSGIVTYYGDGGNLVNLKVASGIVSDTAPLVRDTGDPLQEGDLWFDSAELRQYTYYTGLWVDSNPQRTVPPLSFAGNQGSSTLDLELDTFNIVGSNNIRTVVGVGSTVQISLAEDLNLTRNLTVAGVATFSTDVDILGNLNVTGDIVYDEISGRNLSISGITTLGTVQISSGIITATVGVVTYYGDGSNLTGTGLTGITNIDIEPRNLRVTGVSTFVGVATFQNDLYVGGDLNVLGDLTFDEATLRNLTVTGITTLGTVKIESGIVTATTGVVTYYGDGSNLTGVGLTQVNGIDVLPRNLRVTGISTFVGVATFQNAIYADGVLNVKGAITGEDITGRNVSFSGISTLAGDLNANGNIVGDTDTNISGINSVTASTFYGDGSNLTGIDITDSDVRLRNLEVSGIATITNSDIGNLNVTTALATPLLNITDSVIGVATFVDDINANGNIVGDTATNISGINSVTAATFYGDGSNLTGIDITDSDVRLRNLEVTGLSTFVGVATFQNDLYVDGNLNVTGDIVYDEVSGRNLSISGVTTLGTVQISSGIITATVGVVTYYGDGSGLTGVGASFISIVSDNEPTERPDQSALVNGDLWYDSLGLRQYTYYFDGVSSQWVDSNPQRTIPPLNFDGNSGSGSVGLSTEVFSIVGGDNIYTVGSGLTLTVGVSTDINVGLAVAQDLRVTGVATFVGETQHQGGLSVTGGIVASGIVTAQDFFSLSDENLKTGITTVPNALSGIIQLSGVSFNWLNDGRFGMGVVAQQVEAVFPGIVTTSDFYFDPVGVGSTFVVVNNAKRVNYNGLIAVLIEAVKDLKAENDDIRSRLDALENP